MSKANSGIPLVHVSMCGLRVSTGLALIYYQGWEQFSQGWSYLWSNTPWKLVNHFSAGHPVPVAAAFAFVTAGFFFLSPLLLMLGFLTRLNALLIFLGLLLCLDRNLNSVLSTSLHTQTLALYLLVTLFFFVNGGGMLAADRVFDSRRGRSRTAGGLYS